MSILYKCHWKLYCLERIIIKKDTYKSIKLKIHLFIEIK